MNNIYRPYTYLIGWSKFNVWYYGARYCNSVSQGIANPSDLWVSYFTSSKVVKEFRRKHGDPDVIEVRHTFTDRSKALLWEDGVLSSIPEVSRIQWLNRRFGDTFRGVTLEKLSPEHCAKISASKVGKKLGPRSEATKLKISERLKGRPSPLLGSIRQPLTTEEKLKVSEGLKIVRSRTCPAKTLVGVKLGNISLDDPRWKSGEIVGHTRRL